VYQYGGGVPQNYEQAVKWYTKAAEQGEVYAQFNLGSMYRNGQGVPQNGTEAVKWYTKAAEQGDVMAQIILGGMYKYGESVPQNGTEAVKWYTKAAEQGSVTAQNNLGEMHRYGYNSALQNSLVPRLLRPIVYGYVYDGLPQDYKEAVKWYTKAAEQGDAGAQFNLGSMYRNGQGVPQNYKEAYIWASLAAAHSPAPEGATKVRDAVAKKLPPKDLIAAQQRAAELQKQIEANQLEANQGKTAIQPPIRLPYYP
jgi:TPR repeat protein